MGEFVRFPFTELRIIIYRRLQDLLNYRSSTCSFAVLAVISMTVVVIVVAVVLVDVLSTRLHKNVTEVG